jgi:uncharacterized protein YndB with AHSA1/START domain
MANRMNVLRTITINKPVQQVFDYLKLTKNQDNYSVWNMRDPEMKREFTGTDGEVGFIYKWDSDKGAGAGEQETMKIELNKRIDHELRFLRPMKTVSAATFLLFPEGDNKTRVEWSFSGPMKFPMSLLKFLFKKMLGKDMDKSLANLKSILEK